MSRILGVRDLRRVALLTALAVVSWRPGASQDPVTQIKDLPEVVDDRQRLFLDKRLPGGNRLRLCVFEKRLEIEMVAVKAAGLDRFEMKFSDFPTAATGLGPLRVAVALTDGKEASIRVLELGSNSGKNALSLADERVRVHSGDAIFNDLAALKIRDEEGLACADLHAGRLVWVSLRDGRSVELLTKERCPELAKMIALWRIAKYRATGFQIVLTNSTSDLRTNVHYVTANDEDGDGVIDSVETL